MPSQLQWKSGCEGMPVYMDAHFWNLTQCLPSPGFCVFMMLGPGGGVNMDMGIEVVLVQPSGRGFCWSRVC